MTSTDPISQRNALLDAALAHVPFDGWSQPTFVAAAVDAGIPVAQANVLCPRGALDLAVAYHRRGDGAIDAAALGDLRYSQKVAALIRMRIMASDKDIVRKGMALFSLPHHAAEGGRLIWGTADAIWTALGDSSRDVNWYTKRATLSAVYGSTVLYWLGDTSDGDQDTWDFLDRRIENVMQFEKTKARVRANGFLSGVMALPNALAAHIRAPAGVGRDDLPGGRQR